MSDEKPKARVLKHERVYSGKVLDLDLDDSWGLAGQAGVDYELENDWLLNASVWYINIEPDAKLTGLPSFDVEIDPWVFMLGVGKKF